MRKEWRLTVYYPINLYFKRPIGSEHFDNVIATKLHKRVSGSGMELCSGLSGGVRKRDLSFYYRSEDEAEKGRKIALRIKGVIKAELEQT